MDPSIKQLSSILFRRNYEITINEFAFIKIWITLGVEIAIIIQGVLGQSGLFQGYAVDPNFNHSMIFYIFL